MRIDRWGTILKANGSGLSWIGVDGIGRFDPGSRSNRANRDLLGTRLEAYGSEGRELKILRPRALGLLDPGSVASKDCEVEVLTDPRR